MFWIDVATLVVLVVLAETLHGIAPTRRSKLTRIFYWITIALIVSMVAPFVLMSGIIMAAWNVLALVALVLTVHGIASSIRSGRL